MLDSLIIIVFLAVNLFIGVYSSKKIKDFSQYAVWKRSFGSFAICATLSASFIGGGYVMGNASKVYDMGLIYAFGLLGFSLKEILVATFIAPRMQSYSKCHSVGDMMGMHYGQSAKVITGIFSIIICTGILGAQVSAIGALLSLFFHVGDLLGILIGFGIIIVYTSLGGMRGVVYTDILQFSMIVIGIPLIFIFGLYAIGGWSTIQEIIPKNHINPFLQPNGVWILLGLVLTFVFGEILVPPYVQRLFMTRHTTQTRNATLASGVISIPIFLIAGSIGLIAYCMNASLDPNTSIPYVVEQSMPIDLRGFVIASLVSVIMSSAAGFLNASVISFCNDILPSITNINRFSHKQFLYIAKLVSFIVGIGSLIFAVSIKNILDILIYAYNLWSPIIVIPLLAAIFGLPVKARQFYISGLSGLIATLVWSFGLHDAYHITSNVVGVFVSLCAFIIIYYYDNKCKTS